MSLFGAKKRQLNLRESLNRAKENLENRMGSVTPTEASATSSSHIGGLLHKITGPLTAEDPEGTATSSEIAREELGKGYMSTPEFEALKEQEKKDMFEYGLCQARVEDELRRRKNSQATPRVESGQLPSDLDDMREYSDLTGKTGVTGIARYGSDDSSELSPPPTTSYGGSIAAFPPSTLLEDPLSTPKASAGIIARRYIQSEENDSMHVTENEGEEGMPETPKRSRTPTLEHCDSEDGMTEVPWRDEEPYMTSTKQGKKRNKGKGVRRPETP